MRCDLGGCQQFFLRLEERALGPRRAQYAEHRQPHTRSWLRNRECLATAEIRPAPCSVSRSNGPEQVCLLQDRTHHRPQRRCRGEQGARRVAGLPLKPVCTSMPTQSYHACSRCRSGRGAGAVPSLVAPSARTDRRADGHDHTRARASCAAGSRCSAGKAATATFGLPSPGRNTVTPSTPGPNRLKSAYWSRL